MSIQSLLLTRVVDFSGEVVIKILPAIPTEGLTKADLEGLVSKAYTTMSDEYSKLSEEVLPAVQKSK